MARRFRFSLLTILLICIPVGFGSLWYRDYLINRRPLQWDTYAEEKIEKHLNSGRPVLILVDAEWDMGTGLLRSQLEMPISKRRLRNGDFLTMEIDIHVAQHTQRLQKVRHSNGRVFDHRYSGGRFLVLLPDEHPRVFEFGEDIGAYLGDML